MTRGLAYTLVVILVCLSLFQVFLAAGAPLGGAAWGGAYRVLPAELRWGSFASALLSGLALLLVLEKLGALRLLKRPRLVNGLLLGLGALFGLSAAANIASSSPWERYLMFPFAAVVCAACVALGLERRRA